MEKPSIYDDVEGGVLLLFNNQFEIADEFFLTSKGLNPRAALHYAEVQQCNLHVNFVEYGLSLYNLGTSNR